MSIQKKSLISTLKTAKKANVAASSQEVDAKGAKVASMRLAHGKQIGSAKTASAKMFSGKNLSGKNVSSAKNLSGKNVG